jgi:hypothetical protein
MRFEHSPSVVDGLSPTFSNRIFFLFSNVKLDQIGFVRNAIIKWTFVQFFRSFGAHTKLPVTQAF